MAKVSTNISLDAELKKSAQTLFAEFGLDLSTAISLFLSQAVREQRIPFEIRKEIPNAETRAALAEYEEMKTNPFKYPRYNSFDDLVCKVAEDAEDYKFK